MIIPKYCEKDDKTYEHHTNEHEQSMEQIWKNMTEHEASMDNVWKMHEEWNTYEQCMEHVQTHMK